MKNLSSGSWVTPQILVILSLTDKEFKSKAESIIKNGFRINYQGEASGIQDSLREPNLPEKKLIAAAHFLYDGTIENPLETDKGGNIAKKWKEKLMKLIELNKIEMKK